MTIERMPTKNRVINWLQRDYPTPYSKSGYRRDLASVVIDRKPVIITKPSINNLSV